MHHIYERKRRIRRRRKKRNQKLLYAIAEGMVLLGILILSYPVISNNIAKRQQENVITGYTQSVSGFSESVLKDEWKKAEEYNKNPENYMSVLNIEGDGVMGYIEIPKIDVKIPIYHGANESSLKKGAGHVEQTELPVGQKGCHPVITGHRGLPGASLFTRLDEMEMGDRFYICVLDKRLVYEVDQIKIVLPEEANNIESESGRDLITLVTCTPYGVNTHRLLIRGERISDDKKMQNKDEVDISKKVKLIIYIMILFAGAAIIFYPYFKNYMYCRHVGNQKKIFLNQMEEAKIKKSRLYEELKRRNEKLYQEKQSNFTGVESYTRSTINLKMYGLDNNVIGFISIPKMKTELPIYLGASEENMKKGAVHLTETSYPIGGENTNCVIAAHRGYSKAAMFREIEKLEIGDYIYIENFKEKLTYKVVQLRIIAPSDIEQILIRKGKDMITLITCHPYRKNSQRYVVFCERI